MSREVIFTDNFAKPIFQQRATYIIVICCPLFFAGIISWVNINTVNFPCIRRQKGFQSKQVIAFNDEIAVCLIGLEMQFWYFFQRVIRNGQVVIPDDIFTFIAYPVDSGLRIFSRLTGFLVTAIPSKA